MAQEADINIDAVADILKAARKKKKLTIAAVSKETCVRSCYLEAFETGKHAELPALAFALGFVKSYAKALDLDPVLIGNQFKAEFLSAQAGEAADAAVSDCQKRTPSKTFNVPSYQLAQKPKRRWLGWLSPIVGLAGAGLSWMWLGAGSVSVVTTASSIDPTTDARVLAAMGEAPAATDTVIEVSAVTEEGQTRSSSSLFLPAAYADAPVSQGQASSDIVIEAAEDSWLQLSYSDGTELWSGVLRAGQSYRPELIGDVFLTTSNAGGILLKHEDGSTGPLGNRGELIDALELTRENFLQTPGVQTSSVSGNAGQ